MEDGMITLDSESGRQFGFTSDKFESCSYLWKEGNRIIVSCIMAKVRMQGHFSALRSAIENAGYELAIPTPLADMQVILKHWGFKETHIWDEAFEDVELWVKGDQALD
jgi:hypothetical protein